MAKTKITIEIESEDGHFVRSASRVLTEYARDLIRAFANHVRTKPKFSITHDGKDVTEVIQ